MIGSVCCIFCHNVPSIHSPYPQATGDPYYLEAGRTIMDNLNRFARVPCGFAAMKDVRTGSHEDRWEHSDHHFTCRASIEGLNVLSTRLTCQFMTHLEKLQQVSQANQLLRWPGHLTLTFFFSLAGWTHSSSLRCSSTSSCSLLMPRTYRSTWRTTSSRRRHTCCLCHSPRLHTLRPSPPTDQWVSGTKDTISGPMSLYILSFIYFIFILVWGRIRRLQLWLDLPQHPPPISWPRLPSQPAWTNPQCCGQELSTFHALQVCIVSG